MGAACGRPSRPRPRGGPLSIISIFLLKRIDFGNLRGSYVEGIAGVVLMPSQVSCTIQKASDTYQNLDIADDMERLRFKGSLLKRPKPKKNVVPSAPKKLPISLPKNDQISNFLAKRGGGIYGAPSHPYFEFSPS